MAEDQNLEIVRELSHRPPDLAPPPAERRVEILEILEALLLAMVAVLTAWSGYQAARWDGRSALYYGQAANYRARTTQLAVLGGQQKLLDANTFNTWADAIASGHPQVAALTVQHFSPEYRVAFNAWRRTNPLHNAHAPPGPAYMPQYHNHLLEQAVRVDAQATAAFDHGTEAREVSEEYVRTTVILATVLFLVAISQRFKQWRVRLSLVGVGLALLAYALYEIGSHPRA